MNGNTSPDAGLGPGDPSHEVDLRQRAGRQIDIDEAISEAIAILETCNKQEAQQARQILERVEQARAAGEG